MVEEEKVDVQRQSPRSPLRQGPEVDPLWNLKRREQWAIEMRRKKKVDILREKRQRLRPQGLVLQLSNAQPEEAIST